MVCLFLYLSLYIYNVNKTCKLSTNTFFHFQDGSLSDTAVGLSGIDMTRRKPDQRSPKSETPYRERERFGSGMGKKSSSTSQLSATGNHFKC